MKQVLLKKAIPARVCNLVKLVYDGSLRQDPTPLPIKDKNFLSNTRFKSTRSPGLEYQYLTGGLIDSAIYEAKVELKNILNIDFDGPITEFCLPVFKYNNKGVIKAHRDVEKTTTTPKFQNLVAVLMLTQRGDDYFGGRFYVNYAATASYDGKTVTNDYPKDRYYPDMDKGDIFVFDNSQSVHGVEETRVAPEQFGRLTCSFRTK